MSKETVAAKDAEDFLRNEVAKGKTPSVQYLFFDSSAVVFSFSDGLADVLNHKPITPHHLYHAFSTTKTFTALAVLQLAEKGLLNIEHSAKKYLSSLSYSDNIAIKHLLNHTAGIPNPIPLSWIHAADEHQSFNRNNFFQQIFEKHPKVKSQPNEKFAYSNLGYVLLGQVIEQVSGMNYESYVLENIISKLNVAEGELGFIFPEGKPQAKGYQKALSFSNLLLGLFIDKAKFMSTTESSWKPFVPYYINGTSYGGLVGTANSFMKYLQELLKPNSQLIGDDFKKLLFTENKTNNGKPTGMCLSWYTGKLNSTTYFAHAGGGGGYYCEIRLYPEIQKGSVIMFNRTGMTDERILDKTDRFFL